MKQLSEKESRQLDLDYIYMHMAWDLAQASRCPRLKVGSILIDAEGRLRSGGFNGHAKCTDCDNICLREGIEAGKKQEVHCCEHSESNCLMFADTIHKNGGTLYCTLNPCTVCAGLILQSGIKKLVLPNKSKYSREGIEFIKVMTSSTKRIEIKELDFYC